jgi:hypothetical protein
MTVAIAAVAERGTSIIFAMDQMMSIGIKTADLPFVTKGHLVHKRWFALYAGDVTHVPPILQKVKTALSGMPDPGLGDVSGAFVRLYRAERERLVVQAILSPFGLDMPTFISSLSTSQNTELVEMKRKIQDFDFDVEFLVGGFGPDRNAHIFTVAPPGFESHYDSVGFWSIGSGAEASLSSLMFRRLHVVLPLKQTVYHVTEAKFMSEFAMGVGKGTFVVRVTADGKVGVLFPPEVEHVRKLWESEGQPPIPDNLDDRIPDFVLPEDIGKQ